MERHKDNQNFWNFIYSLVFIVITSILLWTLHNVRGSLPTSVPLFDLGLMILATFRLTRLFVYDKITRFIRDLFAQREERTTEEGVTYFMYKEPEDGPLRTAYDLLTCPWCFSVWAAVTVVFFYFLSPLAWTPILILAISGVGSLLQLIANAIGWNAENGKLKAQNIRKQPSI